MPRRDCRDCGAPIVWLRGGPDRWVPVDADRVRDGDEYFEPRHGHVNHVDSCQAGDNVRRDAKGG